MDAVFKALADPTRRRVLDALFQEDGQTLSALESRLPMTRFGVMKHLRVLEEARLITTRRRGREKLHFLNPVPIRLIHDRWVSKFAAPWAAALSALKQDLEAEERRMEKVFEIYIKTTPERLWEAITSDEMRRTYWFGVGVTSDWDARLTLRSHPSTGSEPRSSRARTWRLTADAALCRPIRRSGARTLCAEGTSRVTWEIEPIGDSCKLNRHPRPIARGRQRGDLRRLATGALRPEDLLETGESLTNARLAALLPSGPS